MPPPWTTTSDGALLRASAHDADAFAELYQRHEALVATYLVRRTRDGELAADLTAETFATALLRADRFRDTGEPAVGWLLGIARHQLLQAWRHGRADVRARERLGMERITVADASIERVEALIDADAGASRLDLALQALPPDQRDAVRAHVLDERPYADLAARLGVPEATVRQRVSRGLARMRTALEGPR